MGDANTPMYKALKYQSSNNVPPWQWNELKQKYGIVQSLINELCDEKFYEFTVSGQFEDVRGIHADIQWRDIKLNPGRIDWQPAKQYDSSQMQDPEWVFPDPPKV